MLMNVAVFLSQYDVAGKYTGVVKMLGRLIAEHKHTLVFGGGDEGLMHIIAETVHQNDARVVGVIRKQIQDKAYKEADEIIVVEDAHKMNLGLIERADVIIILIGGIGPLNELTAVVRMKKNAEKDLQTIIVNTDHFYDGLKQQLERMSGEGFIKEEVMKTVHFVDTPEEAIEYINTYGN